MLLAQSARAQPGAQPGAKPGQPGMQPGAQPGQPGVQPGAKPPGAGAADKPANEVLDEDEQEDAAEDEAKPDVTPSAKPDATETTTKAAATSDEVPAEDTDDTEPLPPPQAPKAGDQDPPPYFYGPAPRARVRGLSVGVDAGISIRPAEGDTVSYDPAFAFGAHVRAELLPYLGFRAYFTRANHAVDIPRGALGLEDTQVDQPSVGVTVIGARLEPTWVVSPGLRLWVGAGVAWGRVKADEPSFEGKYDIRVAERSGVMLEWTGALGVNVDIIPEWLGATASVAGGVLSNQSGDIFENLQGVDQGGTLVDVGGLPKFSATACALVGLEAIF
jgi:hypothetical protein